MSEFNAESYVNKWDNLILPVMLVVIVLSLIGAYALNVVTTPECQRHELTYCGEALHGHNTSDH